MLALATNPVAFVVLGRQILQKTSKSGTIEQLFSKKAEKLRFLADFMVGLWYTFEPVFQFC
jgi:hypothetical protein